VVFYYVFKISGPWGKLWSFLLILILAGIAAEAWITPVGPVIWDVAWIPTLVVIIAVALLLGALTRSSSKRDKTGESIIENEKNSGVQTATVAAFGLFFWVFVIFLVIAVLMGIFL
jgi:hypothetical protein